MLGSIVIAVIIILPLFEIVKTLFSPVSENWEHIKIYLLKDYIITTLGLVLAVLLVSTLIAVPLAWILTLYKIPGQKYMKYLLFLPMAIPPYIGTFTYSGIMGYTGIVQETIRRFYSSPPKLFWLEIRGIHGAIFCFSIFLFPYIYLPCKAYLEKNGGQYIESARLLGDREWKLFWRLGLPLLKFPILAGITIITLDIFNDYAVASYLGVNTFSLAILKSWQNYHDISSALRLSGYLLFMTFVIAILFKNILGNNSGTYVNSKSKPIISKKLKSKYSFLATCFVYLIFLISFIIPIGQMIYWTWHTLNSGALRSVGILQMIFNTFSLAFVSSIIILILGIVIGNYSRLFKSKIAEVVVKFSTIGYTIPGAVIAICVLTFFIQIYPRVTQSISMLIFAYILRYFMVGYKNIASGFNRMGMSFHQSSLLLGKNRLQTLFLVDLPMLKFSLVGAFFLSFVDIAKELSLVLILRPFNFYTLSTKVFEYAHDEQIPESSPASLLIILISLLPIIFFLIMDSKKENQDVFRD